MTSISRMTNQTGSSKTKTFVPPAIALERPEKKEYDKSDLLSLKLRSNPADKNSQTYELTVPFFRSGTPEEWLVTKKNIEKVIAGQNITTPAAKYAMTRRILEGDALAKFNTAAMTLGNETN